MPHLQRLTQFALALATGFSLNLATVATSHSAAVDYNSTTPLVGIGVNRLTYWTGGHAMADMARESEFRRLDWSYNIGLDADGAPTEDFYLIFSSTRRAAGTYKLRYTGSATLSINATAEDGSGVVGQVLNPVYDLATNTSTADIYLPTIVSGNSWLTFTNTRRTAASATADGVTQIKLWRPGYPVDDSVLFTAEFVAAMQKFHVIRTMDLTAANNNPSVTWAERPTMARQGASYDKGQAWELLVQMANVTGRDLWINVPVLADDTYITKLAKLLRYGSDGVNPYDSEQANPVYPPLAPNIKVYVEYGNEIWNSGPGFYGFGWALAKANTYRNDLSHPIAFDGAVADQYMALRRWVAYRSATISLAFRDVFGDAKMMSTVRPVLAGQSGNGSLYLSEGLKWADSFYSAVRSQPLNTAVRKVPQLWWGAGGAAYYESNVAPVDTNAATMTAYFAGLPNGNFPVAVGNDSTWARGYGLVSVAYEGGPSVGGSSLGAGTNNTLLSATYNADPRMKTRMQVAHSIYSSYGGQFLNYYVYNGDAAWSFSNEAVRNIVSDTTTVKLQAADSIRNMVLPTNQLGKQAPVTITLRDATAKARFNVYGDTSWGYGGTAYRFSPNAAEPGMSEFALIPVKIATNWNYNISVTTYDAPQNGKLEVFVNGNSVGFINLTASNSGVAVQSPKILTPFLKGLNIIRIRPVSGDIWIKEVLVR